MPLLVCNSGPTTLTAHLAINSSHLSAIISQAFKGCFLVYVYSEALFYIQKASLLVLSMTDMHPTCSISDWHLKTSLKFCLRVGQQHS